MPGYLPPLSILPQHGQMFLSVSFFQACQAADSLEDSGTKVQGTQGAQKSLQDSFS